MENFVIYEKIRGTREGGGIAIAPKRELNPVLTADGDSENEAISRDIYPSTITISFTSAYGPQQHYTSEKKSKFWNF